MDSPSYSCPNCGNQETVNVAETYRENPEQYRAVHVLLKPPVEVDVPPLPRNTTRINERSTGGCVFVFIGVLCLIFIWIFHFVVEDLSSLAGGSPDYPYRFIYAVCGWVPALISFVLAIILFIRKGHENEQVNMEIRQRESEQYRLRNEAIRKNSDYHTIMHRYRNLYYCSQCDRVFIPETGRHSPVGKMEELLK